MDKCKHWLCRLIGHNPVPTTVDIEAGYMYIGHRNRWTCARSWKELGSRG